MALLGAFAGELRDSPFDLVRFLVNLLLNGLVVWFFYWVFTVALRLRRND